MSAEAILEHTMASALRNKIFRREEVVSLMCLRRFVNDCIRGLVVGTVARAGEISREELKETLSALDGEELDVLVDEYVGNLFLSEFDGVLSPRVETRRFAHMCFR